MYIEHFDKCSDLKTIIYKSSDPNSLTDKCAELEEIYNDYEKHGHLYYGNDEAVTKKEPLDLSIFNISNINLLNNLNIGNVNTSGLILMFILIMLVTNIYIAIPLVPFMLAGSVMVSVYAIVLAIMLLFLIYNLFS